MHLIICNERLLFRFGVDRVLLLLAQGLKAAGWRITFVAQRANHDVLRRITDHVHTPPPHHGPYTELDQVTAEWLRDNRHAFVPIGDDLPGNRVEAFAVLVVAGFPSTQIDNYWAIRDLARRGGVARLMAMLPEALIDAAGQVIAAKVNHGDLYTRTGIGQTLGTRYKVADWRDNSRFG